MPTIPPQQARPQHARPHDNEPHRHRQVAESFGIDPERYDRTRPRYPHAMVQRIVAASPGPDVLDVGCGTGIEALQFQEAGCTVLGVEPDARMAVYARTAGMSRVDVSTFEAWEPAGRTFDLVIAGTAWHWVDPVAGVAKALQVLRPGGRLAPFWHMFQLPAEVSNALAGLYQRLVPDSPVSLAAMSTPAAAYDLLFDKAADGIRAAGGFSEPEQWRFEWTHTYTRDEYLDQLPTSGALTRLPAEIQATLLKGVGAAIDEIGGSFTMPYTTIVVTAVRISAATY